VLILIWLCGDCYKLSYYVATNGPMALRLCAFFQICTDICILSQFVIYRNEGGALPMGERPSVAVQKKNDTTLSDSDEGLKSEAKQIEIDIESTDDGGRSSSAASEKADKHRYSYMSSGGG
jgi:hypothetical protein